MEKVITLHVSVICDICRYSLFIFTRECHFITAVSFPTRTTLNYGDSFYRSLICVISNMKVFSDETCIVYISYSKVLLRLRNVNNVNVLMRFVNSQVVDIL